MTYKIVCPVKNNQVVLTLPPAFSNKKQVTVYVDDQTDVKSQKLDALKIAAKDPLFLADIREVHADFDSIEHETL
ncbi:hypothetical protein [Dyadobacter arcticus]|uniref:Uncharacterized protein n=1 Tax=Dyadobacter arcticus TaxID=1078754 RepID=A0ABX0UL81_9BACT|nr:hypothetical protein [Dyadobacter arcticus]NIJ52435.1 hypothetical protein [Dyadobacter arcticus]